MQHEAILILNTTSVRDEFNVTVNSDEDMQRLCRIVSYYYLVEAIESKLSSSLTAQTLRARESLGCETS